MPDTTGKLNSVIGWLKTNFWGVVTLVVFTIGSLVAVEIFKKPGQMNPIEANVMDMSAMVPPRGAVPVGIEVAEERKIEGVVTYTGSVRAYEDEDVYPRITGRIVKMPVYPGDRVKKGQLLVQLDTNTSEYAARADAAKHQEESKRHEAGMARKDFEQAKYTLKAAEQAELAAKQAVEESQAEYDYWVPELKRQAALLKDDVVSQEEYDNELAKSKASKARLQKAKAQLNQAANTKLAAKAAFEKAVHHVGHGFSASEEAAATQKTAKIIDRYRQIRALADGVVTERVISPGVVVEPGMLILKVARIKKVRVQAEVSNTDIDNIELGTEVYISRGKNSKNIVKGRVTSVFPAANKSSRTSIVEALIDNTLDTTDANSGQVKSSRHYRFLPGQYVVMNIVTGSKSAVTIPRRAVFYRGDKPYVWLASSPGQSSKQKKYKCPMHPSVVSDKPGECPKCGMDLELVESEKVKKKYKCPMHPSVVSDKPDECPKCGMNLVPVEAEDIKEETPRKETVYTCTMHPEVESKKPGKCPKCSMDLTPKELESRKLSELVQVDIGLSNPERTEIISGVYAGDEVITMGYGNLQPAVPVIGVSWTDEGIEKLPLASDVAGNRLDSSNNWTLEQMTDHTMLKITLDPIPPKNKNNALLLNLEKHGGSKITGASISAESSMPGMDMKGPDLKSSNEGGGRYLMKSNFHSGLWKVDLMIKGASKDPVRLVVEVEVP